VKFEKLFVAICFKVASIIILWRNEMSLSRRQILKCIAAAPLVNLAACSTAPFGSKHSYLSQIIKPQNQNTVFHWIDVILQQIRDQRVTPPRAAYNLAMPMVAGFLAANGITQDYQEPYSLGKGPSNANPEIAYGIAFAVAAAEVFQQPFMAEKSEFLERFENSEAKSLAIVWGKKVGRHVVRMRNNDGAEPSEVNFYLGRYQRRDDSLKWRPTGPFYSAQPGPAFDSFDRGLFPGQGQIRPWTMSSGSQFRAAEFYDPASPEFAKEFETIRLLGGADSAIRTKDQSEIALFWEDGPWGLTPPGHFIYIGMQVLQNQNLSLIELARSFALLGMTQCDASIAAWDSKYFYDVVRPESAIRVRAEQFGNTDQRVTRQANWRSYIPTPNFPTYTSGHSTFGAAGTETIALIQGDDKISLTGQSPDLVIWPQLRDINRHWTSLSAIAEENGMSRLYGGVHWQLDHTQAKVAGRNIAQQAFSTFFQKRV
jgi:hypothetical protein